MSLATPSSSSLPYSFSSIAPSTTTPSTSTASSTFPFSNHPFHSFPPFYDLQPNLNTRAAQLSAWSSLLTSYCQHEHLFRLSPRHAIFYNPAFNRRLKVEDVAVLFAYMREKGAAMPVAAAAKAQRGWYGGRAVETPTPTTSEAEEVFVLWHSLEEWASLLLDWVEATGQRGAVLTVFEMTEGEQSRGKEWEAMPGEVFRRMVEVLVKRGKAALSGEDEGLGVKFF